MRHVSRLMIRGRDEADGAPGSKNTSGNVRSSTKWRGGAAARRVNDVVVGVEHRHLRAAGSRSGPRPSPAGRRGTSGSNSRRSSLGVDPQRDEAREPLARREREPQLRLEVRRAAVDRAPRTRLIARFCGASSWNRLHEQRRFRRVDDEAVAARDRTRARRRGARRCRPTRRSSGCTNVLGRQRSLERRLDERQIERLGLRLADPQQHVRCAAPSARPSRSW